MSEVFLKLLQLARENIHTNPSLQGRADEAVARQYLSGLRDEVEEVAAEIKENNQVYLTDELSDIAWDYACVLAELERVGYIKSAEEVLTHGLQKYEERAPAFLEVSEEKWEAIKAKQKSTLKRRHLELYGN